METLNGVFDNRTKMQRELWLDGQIVAVWPPMKCGAGLDSLLPWERKALDENWGIYPDPPPRDS